MSYPNLLTIIKEWYDGRGSNPQDAFDGICQILSLMCTPFHHRRIKKPSKLSLSDCLEGR